MAKKFRAGSLYGRTGVFYDAIGIGVEPQGSGLFISGGNLTVEGSAFFGIRPMVSGSIPVAVLNDITGNIDLSNYYPSSNPSGFITGVDTSSLYPRSNPSGFVSQNYIDTVSGNLSSKITKTIAFFTAMDNQPPSTNFATLDTRNSIAVLDFDAATDESAVFVGFVPEGSNLSNGLTVRLGWTATSAISGSVRWGVQFEKSNLTINSDSFDTASEVTSTTSATSGVPTIAEITTTTIDSLTAGDLYRLKVFRNADDATNDTMTGDAELIAVEVRSAA